MRFFGVLRLCTSRFPSGIVFLLLDGLLFIFLVVKVSWWLIQRSYPWKGFYFTFIFKMCWVIRSRLTGFFLMKRFKNVALFSRLFYFWEKFAVTLISVLLFITYMLFRLLLSFSLYPPWQVWLLPLWYFILCPGIFSAIVWQHLSCSTSLWNL